MMYQLQSGRVIYLTIDQYLDLTDLDIQYLISQNSGEYMHNPFTDSAINKNAKETYYDFEFSSDDEEINNIISEDNLFDDIIDLSDLPDV